MLVSGAEMSRQSFVGLDDPRHGGRGRLENITVGWSQESPAMTQTLENINIVRGRLDSAYSQIF